MFCREPPCIGKHARTCAKRLKKLPIRRLHDLSSGLMWNNGVSTAMMPKAQILKELVPVTARGEATRRKLLSAAEEEFGGKGFHAASVSSITTRAGVGQGTFYLYFHSKEEIFVTLVRDIGRKLRKQMLNAAAAAVDRLQ